MLCRYLTVGFLCATGLALWHWLILGHDPIATAPALLHLPLALLLWAYTKVGLFLKLLPRYYLPQ